MRLPTVLASSSAVAAGDRSDTSLTTRGARRTLLTIHLIGNAHIDPVWLWDWREGLNEGIATCRAMVALLANFPEARFIRGEAAVYEHIERFAPDLFRRISDYVAQGRWDIVGGSYIQPDTNLPCTEALIRQFVRGKRYFREKFGVEVTAAWAADSFGHSAGMPEILTAAGMDAFAFTRPQESALPLAKQAFWWLGHGGARILAFRPRDGWYASERANLTARLDGALRSAASDGLDNVAFFYGLGNHGGGPTSGHLRQIREWAAAHPDVRVEHSGLHVFFAALRDELRRKGEGFIPEHRGELNFCLRGCSASAARFKFAYRKAESGLLRAERSAAALAAARATEPADLGAAVDGLLFNAFHDILPGSSIERAMEDQLAQVAVVSVAAQRAEAAALTDLAATIDTRPTRLPKSAEHPHTLPVLLWNPHPWAQRTHVELEVSLDHRPLWAYHKRRHDVPVMVIDPSGRKLPVQPIPEEHDSLHDLPWRRRVVTPVTLPPLGWKVVHMGLPEKPSRAARPASVVRTVGEDGVTNGFLTVRARVGEPAVTFLHRGKPWLGHGLEVRVYDDPWGAWGGMGEEQESWLLESERERWTIQTVHVLEDGPERAALWVRFAGARSRLELTLQLSRGAKAVQAHARVQWNERSARLKLVLPAGGAADFEVPGGVVRREPCGEAPGGRWVRAGAGARQVGFASDALYGFDTTAEEFRATITRSARYASDVCRTADEAPWLPVMDAGELKFRFLLTPAVAALPRLAAELEDPVVALPVAAQAGAREAEGSLLSGLPAGVRLLALRAQDRDTVELRLQNAAAAKRVTGLVWQGAKLRLGTLAPGEIGTWLLSRSRNGWRAMRVPATSR